MYQRKYLSYYRHPRTTNERRANQEHWHRLCRGWKKLPDTYDDIINSYERRRKNWKDLRENQYRVVPVKDYNGPQGQDSGRLPDMDEG